MISHCSLLVGSPYRDTTGIMNCQGQGKGREGKRTKSIPNPLAKISNHQKSTKTPHKAIDRKKVNQSEVFHRILRIRSDCLVKYCFSPWNLGVSPK